MITFLIFCFRTKSYPGRTQHNMNKQYAIISQFYLCNDIVITIITVMLTSYKTTIKQNGGVAMVLALGRWIEILGNDWGST